MPWHLLATSKAALLAGAIMLVLLFALRRHRDPAGKTSPPKIVAAFLFGISVYTLSVLIVCHFYLDNMMQMIDQGFGEPRLAWLFVGLAIDGFARLYRVYDP
jgi:hypothetical protein